ncbi:MAG: hypothetical protein K8I82_11120, partial [Anaerolineae bacterium]|nr:hypothetical protein [Anaerolineae bacterium]
VVMQAIDKNPASRQKSVGDFGQQLVSVFGNIPRKRRSWFVNVTELSIPVVILMVVVFLLLILVLALVGGG